MRIALVHVADKGGGAERSVLTLHQSLLALGHDSRLYVATRQLDQFGVIEIPQKRSVPGLMRITRHIEDRMGLQNLYAPSFRHLAEIIGDVDVLHLHSLWKLRNSFADLTGIVRLSKLYPTVLTLRDGWMMTGHCACPIGCDRWKTGCGACPDLKRAPSIPRDWTATNWKRKRRTIQKANIYVTAVSTWLKQQIEESPIFAGKSIHVVQNSVDENDFVPGDKAAARHLLGIPEHAFVVLLAGQSIEGIHQGISQHAIHALNSLNDSNIVPMLVGRSASLVAATLNRPAIQIPFRDDPAAMAECYRAANLTIVPSEYETFGRVAAESLFCGTPVLAFATGGLTDIVEEGVNGRLVPTGDTQALGQAIAELKADVALLNKMASKCAESSREKFNTGRIASKYLHVYSQVAGSRGRVVAKSPMPPVQIESVAKKISCVIPAFNCEQWLERAVDSVFATNYPELEVLIVDDGSSDKTLDVARRIQVGRPNEVRVLQHPQGQNRGVSASRNLGMLSSTGDWICLLDADDYVYPYRFESAVSVLNSSPDVDGVHQLAEVVFSDAQSQETWFRDQHYFGFDQNVSNGELLERLLNGKCWATSAILFRKSLLDRTGLFSEEFCIAEDCHLWFRMASVGKIVSGDLSKPVSAYWRRSDSAYQPSADSRLQMVRVMAGFLKWLRTASVSESVRRRATAAVQEYVLTGVTESRFSGQRWKAWKTAFTGATLVPSLVLNRRYCGQLARLAVGR